MATPNRIRHLRKVKDLTLEQLAELTGISPSHLTRIENQSRGLSLENLIKIARALEVEPDEVAIGFDPDDLEQAKRVPLGRRSVGDIPHLAIHAGMGAGGALSVSKNDDGEIYSDHVDGFWAFPEIVKAGWRNMPQIYAMPVTGDSMEPTFLSGSTAFVDTSHNVPSPEDIYALDYGDGLMIKRVALVPRSDDIMIISDNDRYKTYTLKRQDVRVYGRVVASFQWRG